ncbi:phosphosulfolactate synthase [Weissella paramesenteroides]
MKHAFEFIDCGDTKDKDVAVGKTMMLDKGLGLKAVDDLLVTAGEYIDFVKLGWGTAATMNDELIMAKNQKYADHGIIPYPGGTLLEVAVLQGKYKEYLSEAQRLGFKGIEVSDGSTQINVEKREQLIKEAREAGFFVISEVGKKDQNLDHQLTIAERVALINEDLANGAHFVIIEAREAGKNIGIYDEDGNIITDELDALAANGTEQLMFEAPLKKQQVNLILRYGKEVNLGNIAFDEITSLATLRQGLRGDTVNKV